MPRYCPGALISTSAERSLRRRYGGGYLKDVLQRLPTQRACDIDELLTHRWST